MNRYNDKQLIDTYNRYVEDRTDGSTDDTQSDSYRLT